MRCKNCYKEIDEIEIFCDDCKEKLKDISSREQLRELNNLIKEQNEFNELEKTKELTDLKSFKDDIVEEIDDIESKKAEVESLREEVLKPVEVDEEQPKEEMSREVRNNNPKDNKKKKLIIISSIVAALIVLIIIIVLLLNNKPKNKNEENNDSKINYEQVINSYGESVKNSVKKYIEEKKEIPTWQQVNELIDYKDYEVICDIHNIYSDGNIYLNSCKVNNKKVKYSYGEEQEEKKEGKKLDIYKSTNDETNYTYSDEKSRGMSLVATLTCNTEDCKYVSAYDKYIVVEEDDKYYLYNYDNNTMEFGPFSKNSDMLSYMNKLYAIYYNEDGSSNLYNVSLSKTIKNIKGSVEQEEMNFNPFIMLKYGYLMLRNSGKYDFVNLKTGNVSYTIKENISKFIEDEKNNIVYMIYYVNNDYTKFGVYNSNGKLLFNGNLINDMRVYNGNLIILEDKNYKVYDSKLNLKLTSKTYDEVLGIYDDFVVVIDNNHLEILDTSDKILATFEDEWDNTKLKFNGMMSGWRTENGKRGIYLIVENKDMPSESSMKYYYIPSTKEVGVIK